MRGLKSADHFQLEIERIVGALERNALAKLPLDRIVSDGYAFLLDVTFMAAAAGLRIAESPIIFVERRQGASKLSSGVLIESLFTPWKLILRHGRIRSPRVGGSK